MKGQNMVPVVLALALAASTLAQQQTNDVTRDRVLLPIATGQIPGAFASLWMAEAVVHNESSDAVSFDADEYCISECPAATLQGGETRHILFRGEPADNPGMIMFVQRPSELVTFESRIQDLSRQALTWGTEIPVIRENRFVTQPLELLNIPMDERFRLMLRIYDIDGRTDGAVRVAVFPFPGRGIAVGHADLALSPPSGAHPKYKPSYVQVDNIRGLVPADVNPGSVIGVRITPLTPGLRLWAFISVTNNETQHVTTITPQ